MIALALLACVHRAPPRAPTEVEVLQVAAAAEARTIASEGVAPRLVPQLGHASGPVVVATSADGRYAATGGADGATLLWDVATGRYLRHLAGPGAPVTRIGWTSSGLIVTLDEDKVLTYFSQATGGVVDRHPNVSDFATLNTLDAIAWIRGGKVILERPGADRAALPGRPVRTALSLAAEGDILHLLVADDTARVEHWARNGERWTLEQTLYLPAQADAVLRAHGRTYVAVGRAIFREEGGQLAPWATAPGAVRMLVTTATAVDAVLASGSVHTLPGGVTATGVSVAPLPAGRVLGGADGTARIEGERPHRLAGAADATSVMAAGPLLVLGGRAEHQQVWDVDTARLVVEIPTPGARFAAIGADGTRLAIVDETDQLHVYNPRTGLVLRTVALELPAGEQVTSLAVPIGRGPVVVGTDGGIVVLVDTVFDPQRPPPQRLSACGSKGVTLVAAGGQEWYAAVAIETPLGVVAGRLDLRPEAEPPALATFLRGRAPRVALSADGRQVGIALDFGGFSRLSTVSARGGTALHALGPGRPYAVAFGPEDAELLWSDADGLRHVPLGLRASRTVALPRGERMRALALASRRGEPWLVGAGAGGAAWLWRWDADEPARASITPMREPGAWAVATPDGYFDVSDAAAALPLHWVLPDGGAGSRRPPGDERSGPLLTPAPLGQLRARWFRPRLLAEALEEEAPLPPFDAIVPVGPTVLRAPTPADPRLDVCWPDDGLRLLVDGRAAGPPSPGAGCEGGPSWTWTLDPRPNVRGASALRVEVTAVQPVAPAPLELELRWADLDGAPRVLTVAPAAAQPHVHAVVIGVSDYAGDVPDLAFPDEDAAQVRAALELGGEATLHRVSDAGGKAEIVRAITEAAGAARPDDVLLVFLAGHGVLQGDAGESPGRAQPRSWSFVTENAGSLDAPEPNAVVTVKDLEAAIAGTRAREVVVILDACASGEAAVALEAARAVDLAADALRTEGGLHVLAATSAGEPAFEHTDVRHGVLTYALLRTLDGVAVGDRWDVEAVLAATRTAVPEVGRMLGLAVEPPALTRPSRAVDASLGRRPAGFHAPVGLLPTLCSPTFTDASWVDTVGLGDALGDALSAPASPVVKLDSRCMWKLGGRYTQADGALTVDAVLVLDGATFDALSFSGPTADAVVAIGTWAARAIRAAQ